MKSMLLSLVLLTMTCAVYAGDMTIDESTESRTITTSNEIEIIYIDSNTVTLHKVRNKSFGDTIKSERIGSIDVSSNNMVTFTQTQIDNMSVAIGKPFVYTAGVPVSKRSVILDLCNINLNKIKTGYNNWKILETIIGAD
jgi:hypothetical protein